MNLLDENIETVDNADDATFHAATNAADAVGYDGSNPEKLAELMFAIADVMLVDYSPADISQFFMEVGEFIAKFEIFDPDSQESESVVH